MSQTKAWPYELVREGYYLLTYAQLIVTLQELGIMDPDGPGLIDTVLWGGCQMIRERLPEGTSLSLVVLGE